MVDQTLVEAKRAALVQRLVRLHGHNPRDWAERPIVVREATRLCADLSPVQIDAGLRRYQA